MTKTPEDWAAEALPCTCKEPFIEDGTGLPHCPVRRRPAVAAAIEADREMILGLLEQWGEHQAATVLRRALAHGGDDEPPEG